MRLYRLADHQYIGDREGIGAKMFGGRWNEVDCPCLYTSEHLSLALLEKFVHAQFKEHMSNLAVLEIEVKDADGIFHVDEAKLQRDWKTNIEYTQWIGEQLLSDLTVVAFSVPSVIIPSERNYILNPRAKAFDLVRFNAISDFESDYRLLHSLM